MPRPLRDLAPENYHLVTVRTEEARIWMVPEKKLNSTIGGVIARYQEVFGIIIYTFCILGNHIHMVLKAKDQNLDEFMENVLREIARRVNWHNKRHGHFWSRRYDNQVISALRPKSCAILARLPAVRHYATGLSRRSSKSVGGMEPEDKARPYCRA